MFNIHRNVYQNPLSVRKRCPSEERLLQEVILFNNYRKIEGVVGEGVLEFLKATITD